MNKKLYKLSIFGFVFVGILGSISHFVYEWSGYNRAVGAFFPVNESSWEHLKLLLLPYLIWAVVQYFLLNKQKGILFGKAIGVIGGMLSILIIYYTYSGIIGKNIGFINILSFFIGVLIAFIIDYEMIKSNKFNSNIYDIIGIILFVILSAIFVLFTFLPPLIPLFKDPLSLSYGI